MEPFEVWLDEAPGAPLPLPPRLASLHGPLRFPVRRDRPHVFANFVSSIDGVVTIDPPRGTGGDISARDAHDRALMALLRAAADAVVIGSGTLRAEPRHVWIADRLAGDLADDCRALRAALSKPPQPLQIVVTASGDVELAWPVFTSAAPSLVVTTAAGAARLNAQKNADEAEPRVVAVEGAGVSLRSALAVAGLGAGSLVLCECGPTLLGRFLAERAVDELFLTVASRIVGRSPAMPTFGLVEGVHLGTEVSTDLVSARRHGSFLFLRYAFPPT